MDAVGTEGGWMQRSRPASEASMDEILASIRKIISDDTVPGPGGTSTGRIEPKLSTPDPIPADKPQPDRRLAASIDRDLADLLNDPAPVPAPAAHASASPSAPTDQRLAKPGWLTGGAPAPAPGPAALANAGRPLPLTAKLDQARSEPAPAVRAPTAPAAAAPSSGSLKAPAGPLPSPSRPGAPPPGPQDLAPPSATAAVDGTGTARAPEALSGAKVETPGKPAVDKRAELPVSPALAALASFAQHKAPSALTPPGDGSPPRGELPATADPSRAPAAAAAVPADPPPAPVPPAAPAPAMAAAPLPALSAEALVAALPSSRPPAAGTAATVRSVEDLIADLLRPMLRQWLDENMPRIVEKALRIELAQGLKLPTLPVATGKADTA